jgi:ATP-binding protein involved in chromosome partitioning
MSDHQSPFVPANYSSDSEKSSNSSDPVVEARKQEAIECLKQVLEPILNKDIVSLGMVRNFQVVDNYVYFRLYIGAHQQYLQERAQTALSSLTWCKKTYIHVCTIPGVRTTLAVSSGKGGVGKSTTAVNLAAALKMSGARVGLLDADVYGPNVPTMLGLSKSDVRVVDTENGQKFLPLEAHGIKVMSVGLLAEPDHPLAWRGPVLHKIVTQFINEVEWGDLDYLLIDLPPGTGDAQITIVQESPICGAILVTTPQQVAISDVRRSIHMFRGVGVPVIGLIENMSYLVHRGEHISIFGNGGGEQMAAELQVPLMGQVPLDSRICQSGDTGQPLLQEQPKAILTQAFVQIATGLNTTFALPTSTQAMSGEDATSSSAHFN